MSEFDKETRRRMEDYSGSATGNPPPAPNLRDMFAAYAVTGLLGRFDPRDVSAISVQAFAIADAMMAERSKRNG